MESIREFKICKPKYSEHEKPQWQISSGVLKQQKFHDYSFCLMIREYSSLYLTSCLNSTRNLQFLSLLACYNLEELFHTANLKQEL
jgi:hypothetical protein